jgi:hypothetical protein
MLVYLIKKLHAPTKRATVILIKVKLCIALLHMLLVFIRDYLKSVLRYEVLILDTYHQDGIHTSKDVRIRSYFSRTEGVYKQKSLGNTDLAGNTWY